MLSFWGFVDIMDGKDTAAKSCEKYYPEELTPKKLSTLRQIIQPDFIILPNLSELNLKYKTYPT